MGEHLLNDRTFVDLVQRRASEQPQQIAYTFLVDGETEEANLTYQELDQQAQQIAACLQSMAGYQDRVLLILPPGLEYITAFLGCLYAGVIAVPSYPPHAARQDRKLPQLRNIIRDAEPVAALTTGTLLPMIQALSAQIPEFQAIRWLAVDALPAAADWQRPAAINEQSLAFLQYTSGSTNLPKGVMLTHANLLANQALIREAFQHTADSIILGWLPLYHDMGLIGNVLHPLYMGVRCILMSPVAFLQKPLRWLEAISRYRATTSGGPNFAYELCLRKIPVEQRESLDLSSWTVAFNGAEPIRAQTLERFSSAFAAYGFRREAFFPCYGLAEATLIVAGGPAQSPPVIQAIEKQALEAGAVLPAREPDSTRLLVGSGQLLSTQQVAIVDPESRCQLPPDRVGEIWVSGPSVAQGYWNREQTTAETFHARTANTGAGPFLRTGDLGFLHDGQIYVTGRLKDLIIIRGRNHYPQDIEQTVEQSHPALRAGHTAAFALERDGEEQLVVVQEIEREHRHVDPAPIIAAIRQSVAEDHEIPVATVVLVKPGAVPKTSSGKIQRYLCRQRFLHGELDVLHSSAIEAADEPRQAMHTDRATVLALAPAEREPHLHLFLQALARETLNIGATIPVDQPLTALGLDSLAAVELQHRLETTLGVEVPMLRFLQGATIAEITAEISAALTEESSAPVLPEDVAEQQRFPLSQGQRALWFVQRLAPDSAMLNIASAIQIRSRLDLPAFRRSWQQVVARHPLLRAAIHADESELVHTIQPAERFRLEERDASTWEQPALHDYLVAEANRPFDLERGPLLRVSLLSQSSEQHVLLVVIHHIVADFWSLALVLHELGQIYQTEVEGRASALPPLTTQYADVVRRQRELLTSDQWEQHWRYWRDQLGLNPPVLQLPTDRVRPPVQSYRGANIIARLPGDLLGRIKALGQQHSATLYVTLLAAFEVLLHRYSGQSEFIVGSPTTGRSHADTTGVVGYFVNPLPIRADLTNDPAFAGLLQRVRESVLAAFAHQEYPFVLLTERLQPERDPSRPPIFQAMFTYQQAPVWSDQRLALYALNASGGQMDVGGLRIESLPLPQNGVQVDLSLMVARTGDDALVCLQYNCDLFDATTIQRMLDHFVALLEEIAADPLRPISELPLLSAAEQQHLLATANPLDYPSDRTLHQLFEEQVVRRPTATAVIYEDRRLSFAELNGQANLLAGRLRELGLQPDMPVALYLDRSLEAAAAMLAVLKAGAGYLPLDPSYPPRRLAFMLADAAAPVVITQPQHQESLNALLAQLPSDRQRPTIISLDSTTLQAAAPSQEAFPSTATPQHMAYLIYTSGSTGQPKGVIGLHDGAINRFHWMWQVYPFTEDEIGSQKTSLSFLDSLWELFGPLLQGIPVVIIPDDAVKDPARLVAILRDQRVTRLVLVPSLLRVLLDSQPNLHRDLARLRYCTTSGEALPIELGRAFQERLPDCTLLNLYGSSEVSADATWYPADRVLERERVPIGRPIANTGVYVVDAQMRPVPAGVPGELYIGGVGIARGYWRRPDLTAERFVPDPFSGADGARLYRTGDLARWLPDGNLEYLDRSDQQVKIRGFRVELGEIEAALRKHPLVQNAAVIVRETAQRPLELAAYLVPEPGARLAYGELRADLRQSLPEYMIPTAFLLLDALPLTDTGKTNRLALPGLDAAELPRGSAYVAAKNRVEATILTIWQSALGLEQIGTNDNFFDLGGHSLLIASVHRKLEEQFQTQIPLVKLLEHPTISSLAGYLSQIAGDEERSQRNQERARMQQRGLIQQQRRAKLARGSIND